MADLTDADKKSFIDSVTGILQEADNVTLLKSKDWDPTQRATNLANAQKAITKAEGLLSTAKQGLELAIANRRSAIDDTYELASKSVSSVEGALDKDHSLVKRLHGLRGAMSRPSPKPNNPGGGSIGGDGGDGASGGKPA